jgi:hypothetical protein
MQNRGAGLKAACEGLTEASHMLCADAQVLRLETVRLREGSAAARESRFRADALAEGRVSAGLPTD